MSLVEILFVSTFAYMGLYFLPFAICSTYAVKRGGVHKPAILTLSVVPVLNVFLVAGIGAMEFNRKFRT